MNLSFQSDVFPTEQIELAGTTETVVRGSRELFGLLPAALRGVEEIGVLGWGTQGAAQAMNLRQSLAGTGIKVSVGLRGGSSSAEAARTAGFSETDGTLGDLFEVAARSDLVLLLIADAAQAELYPKLFDAMQPGSTLGLSHGFLVGHLRLMGDEFPDDINVIGVCPKGMGLSVRRLYQQGAETNGAGINSSFAVEQDVDGWAGDMALAWAIGIGSPFVFRTTLDSEYRSDIFGERGVLLGGVHGLVEALYRRAVEQGAEPDVAFQRSAATVTGPVARLISRRGLRGLYEALAPGERGVFRSAYNSAYGPFSAVLAEIYDEVDSGRELASVVAAGSRLERHPMGTVEGTEMWSVGRRLRSSGPGTDTPLDPTAAGCFAALMMAQVDLLREHGHPWSEVANESVIEEVDSLLPFMHARGVAYMVDNCSTTARLGARRWGPLFEAVMMRETLPAHDGGGAPSGPMDRFADHPLHEVLDVIGRYRPSIDIAVE